MPTLTGSLRRLIFTPSLAKVTFAGRGFPVTASDATRQLEAIPQAVVCGFEWGIDTRSHWETERKLAMVEPGLRGFGYEGAVMAYTILDALAGGTRTRDLLRGPGEPHIFLAFIGMGFAMARLPRVKWKKVVPDLSGSPYYPTMSWLAVDGYGFDRAYFDTGRWVDRQQVPAPYPWEGSPRYFLRAVDQGIGRALWFIHGASAPAVTAGVTRFAPHRQPDLWSGVGLAATFAGGCPEAGLAGLRDAAGDHRPELAQGAVFAAKARSYAGFVPEYTHAAVAALTGQSTEQAVAIADAAAVHSAAGSHLPAYELWRQAVRSHFGPSAQDAAILGEHTGS
jgi:enediyne biosynthesis protein E2